MKAQRLACALLFAGLLAACPKKKDQAPPPEAQDAGPAQVSEREPNDRPEQAQTLSDSTVVTASLTAEPNKGDEDWYALTAATPKVVDLAVSGIPGGDVLLEIYDTDRNRLAVVNSAGEGLGERLPNFGVLGKVLVRVAAAKRGTGGSYTLTALFRDAQPGFELEPNDRAADSNELKLGESMPDGWKVSGYIGHSGDEDWYRVDLQGTPTNAPARDAGSVGAVATVAPVEEDAGIKVLAFPVLDAGATPPAPLPPEPPKVALKVDLTAVPGVRLELQIVSEAQAVLFSGRAKRDESLSFRNLGVRAADTMIYVVVRSTWLGTGKDAKKGFNADTPYTLSIQKEAEGANAEYEPNDEPAKATPIAADGFRDGFIAAKADVDYYVLRTPQPITVHAQLSGVERLDLTLSVIKPPEKPGGADQVLLKANDGAVKEPEVLNNVSCAGECYFKVEGTLKKVNGKWARDYENADQTYRLTLSTVPDDGSQEREPNDTPANATPIAFGKPIRGTIHPKKDVDLYKLDLTARQVKTPLKATVTGILKVDVGLYLWKLGEDGKELVQTSEKAKGDQPETIRYSADPGTYLLEVRDQKNRESNFQDSYQLTVDESE